MLASAAVRRLAWDCLNPILHLEGLPVLMWVAIRSHHPPVFIQQLAGPGRGKGITGKGLLVGERAHRIITGWLAAPLRNEMITRVSMPIVTA